MRVVSGVVGAFVVAFAMTSPALALSVVGTTTATSNLFPECRPSSTLVCLSNAASGRVVVIRRGRTVTVTLGGSGLVWSDLHVLGPLILHSKGRAIRSTSQIRESYVAVRTGRTTLQATAAPKCTKGQICPQFLVLWQARITVTA